MRGIFSKHFYGSSSKSYDVGSFTISAGLQVNKQVICLRLHGKMTELSPTHHAILLFQGTQDEFKGFDKVLYDQILTEGVIHRDRVQRSLKRS